MSKTHTYTCDGTEWRVNGALRVQLQDVFCGYDGCGESGPIVISAADCVEMLDALGYDTREVKLKE